MTVSTTASRKTYSGNGSTVDFSFPYKFFADGDLVVVLIDSSGTETTQVLNTDYTVSGEGTDTSGQVSMSTAPASGETLVIYRSLDLTQDVDYISGDAFPAETHEQALDRLTLIAQQLDSTKTRSVRLADSVADDPNLEITESAANRANKVISFDSTGDLQVTQELGVYQGTDTTTTTAAYNERDLVKSTTTAQLNNVYIALQDSPAGTALTNTSYWALLVDAASASSAQTAAETAQSAAEDAQGYAEEWATKAEDSLISTDAGGDGSTDYSSLHHAAKASASASNAATSESNAADWAVKTDGIVDSTDYAAKAWSIGGTGVTDTASAGAAKEWATKAEDSTVDGTEYSAKHYAAKAAASAAAAATSADDFDDRYLGPKSSDPTLDNDGDALTTGDLYFNTSSNLMKVYNGSSWDQVAISSTGLLTVANNLSDLNDAATARTNLGVQIGVDVQAYDADTLKADVADTITASMRGTVTTDNDLSFDMNATNNFSCTPTGTGALTFTNITSGQSGNIYLDNSGGHVISAAATTFISAADLTKISTAGKYFVSYYSADGTNVLVSASSAVTASGV